MNTLGLETPLTQRLRLAKGLSNFHDDYFQKLLECQHSYTSEAFNNPEKYVFIDYYIPAEIVHAFGLIPVMSEHAVNFMASMGMTDELLNLSDKHYLSSGTCTFHKPILPAFEKGIFEKPKAFMTTTLCNEAAKCFSMIANKYKKNFYCIDLPYDRSDEALDYVAEQYRKLVKKMSADFGIDFDINNLIQVLEKSNIMRDYLVKGNHERKQSPSLVYGSNMLRFGGSYSFHGTDDAIDIARSYYQLMKKRRLETSSPIQNEKYRLLWCHLRPFYSNDFFEHMENGLGAVIAFEETNYIYWDKLDITDPFKALARKTMDWLYQGDVNRRIERMIEMCRDYDIDGVVHFSHINCRVLNPKVRPIKDALGKEKIPFLDLSGDCIDKRNFSSKQLLTRLEAFTEMLDSRC